MARIKKAQTGAGVPKGMVKGEMTGKLYPKKQMDEWQKSTAKDMTAQKKSSAKENPYAKAVMEKSKKKMKDGGKSFPDLNKDGKITKADILKGRGVIAKKGAKMKKCKYGCK